MVPVQTGAAEMSSTLLATARNNVQQYTGDTVPPAVVEADNATAESAKDGEPKDGEEEQQSTVTPGAEDGQITQENAATADTASTADAPTTSAETAATTTEPESSQQAQNGLAAGVESEDWEVSSQAGRE